MKRKILSLLIAGVMAVSMLSGCSTGDSREDQSQDQNADVSQEGANGEQTDPEADSAAENDTGETAAGGAEDGKVLVVYFSATGNTEEAANYIAEATGGDLFELEPVEPYTDDDLDYNDDNSRVSREYADESLRDVELVSTVVDGFDEYQTVFVGYPIWWGIAAWPVNQFVENNDFTGKTVVPFCTSSSSGLGESGQLPEEMAGTGNWLEGQRFRSGASRSDVQDWVEGLGL